MSRQREFSGKSPGISPARRWAALTGMFLLLLGGCADQGRRGYTELDGYSMEDFEPYQQLLVENEFTEHPELVARTVYHLSLDIGDPPGEIEARVRIRFTNGQSEPLGKVALARFNNLQGLRQIGDTSWAESFSSGDVQMGEAGTSSYGLIQSGALENSNVDLATQLVNLITAQRNFQANAQVITTADAVTQSVINIR